VEKKLVKKVGELNEELVANAARVAQALRMSEEDGATIDDLKAQVERAWGLVEAANTRAEAATQEVERLSAETAAQGETLARHQELIGEGASLEDIVATRDSLNARLLDAQKGLVGEKARSEGLVAELAARSEKLKAKREEIRGLNDALAAKGMEDAKKDRQLASMQADMSALKAEAGEKSSAVDAAERAKAAALREQERLQKALDGQKAANTAALSEATELRSALAKARDEAAALVERAGKLGEERAGLEKALKAASGEAVKERAAAAKSAKKLELAEKEVAQQRNLTSGANEELAKLRAEVQSAGRELVQEQLAVKDKERAVAKLNTQKGAAEARADAEAAKKEEVELSAAALAAQVAALNAEIKALKTALIKQRMVAESFERAAARREAEREEAKAACAEAEEALAMRATQVGEMERREDELNAKLRASHAAFDAMRAERNAALKSAGAAGDEVKELERREGVTHKQMQHLKQEVMEKDKALINEQFEVSALTKRANTRAAESAQLRKLLEEAAETIKRQGDDVDRLSAALRRADAEAVAQKRAFDSLLTERDTLSAHLTRRNDELVLTNEKATVQAAALAKGEKLYDARAEEVRTLKLKVRSCAGRGWPAGRGEGVCAPLCSICALNPAAPPPPPPTLPLFPQIAECLREQQIASAGSAALPVEIKRQLVGLQRDLHAEQSKVKLLSSELENPVNVHRWRKLAGTDPEMEDLLQRHAMVQKKLIQRTEEVAEKELALAERDKQLAAERARAALGNTGRELGEQLSNAQHLLAERTRQLKAVASEVNMFQAQAAEAKFEVERLHRELAEARAGGGGGGLGGSLRRARAAAGGSSTPRGTGAAGAAALGALELNGKSAEAQRLASSLGRG
jgi:chromosome segregation ATPase